MTVPNPNLVVLCQKIADLTEPECANTCKAPHSCCQNIYCEEAARYAEKTYGIILERTDHLNLPFMGETGCTVAPYLRPLCAVHTCDISTFGIKPTDPKWTRKYFRLRDKINELLPY